jgi:hypothetical protein
VKFLEIVFVAAIAGCVAPNIHQPLETLDLCATHPQFCELCEDYPCGGYVVVCCEEGSDCLVWGNRQTTETCDGTIGLCRIGMGEETNAQGYNPVKCYRVGVPHDK